MAQIEQDRHDLFAEARALVPKILFPISAATWQELIGPPVAMHDARVAKSLTLPAVPDAGLAGLFRDGRLAVYLGQDWMIRLSPENRVLRAYRFGLLFQSTCGATRGASDRSALIQIVRQRTDSEVQLLESLVAETDQIELLAEWRRGLTFARDRLADTPTNGWRSEPTEISQALPALQVRLDLAIDHLMI